MDQDLNLSVPVGTTDRYTHLNGTPGKIQKLWARHCGLSLQIEKLQAELRDNDQELLRLDPSFFRPTTSLVGSAYFPFRPQREEKPGPEVAKRNAIILQCPPSLSIKKVCL